MNFHPISAEYPLLEGSEFEKLADDIAARGLEEPIWTFRGSIIDGRNRFRACEARGVEPKYREWKGKETDLAAFVRSMNRRRRHLTMEQQREAVESKLLDNPDKSNRLIAKETGASDKTVAKLRKNMESTADIPQLSKTVGADNKERPARKPTILCERCTRIGAVAGCNMCKEARAKPGKASRPEPADDNAPLDNFKNVVPKRCRDAWGDPWIQETFDLLATVSDKLLRARLADGMAKRKKAYPFFAPKDFIDGCGFVTNYLDDLIQHLKTFRPAGVCPSCEGKGCPDCSMSGLVYRELYAKLLKKAEK